MQNRRRPSRGRSGGSAVAVVTTAGRSHSDDITRRQRRYLALQSLRVVCLLFAATVPAGILVRGALLVGAIVLPYFGVVMANAGPSRERRPLPRLADPAVEHPERLAISPHRVIDSD